MNSARPRYQGGLKRAQYLKEIVAFHSGHGIGLGADQVADPCCCAHGSAIVGKFGHRQRIVRTQQSVEMQNPALFIRHNLSDFIESFDSTPFTGPEYLYRVI